MEKLVAGSCANLVSPGLADELNASTFSASSHLPSPSFAEPMTTTPLVGNSFLVLISVS